MTNECKETALFIFSIYQLIVDGIQQGGEPIERRERNAEILTQAEPNENHIPVELQGFVDCQLAVFDRLISVIRENRFENRREKFQRRDLCKNVHVNYVDYVN